MTLTLLPPEIVDCWLREQDDTQSCSKVHNLTQVIVFLASLILSTIHSEVTIHLSESSVDIGFSLLKVLG